MRDLPAPLTPPDCDLRDFTWMPIDIGRLFASEFHALSTDAEWRSGFTLWLRAYQQMPAASLPDDDVALARLAELGRDVKAWRKIRIGALRGWTLCDDGRLYHRTVAEKALEAWIDKLLQRKSSGAGNAKRHGTVFDPAAFDAKVADALARLEALNPGSRSLGKRFLKAGIRPPAGAPGDIPAGAVQPPAGSDEASHRDPGGSPAGAPGDIPAGSQQNRPDPTRPESKKGSPKRAPPDRTRKAYREDFERFWSAYPTDPNMSKSKAAEAWGRLSDVDRLSAAAAVPGFLAHCRKDLTYRPVHAVRFLTERRFDGFLVAKASVAQSTIGPFVELQPGCTVLEATVVDVIRRGGWIDGWGPGIGKPGCRVPERLIEAARRAAA